MFYEYLELEDETSVSYSEIKEKGNVKFIEVQFERPRNEGGFYSARCELPSNKWVFNEFFSEKDLKFFNDFLKHNANTIFKYASTVQ